MTKTTTRPKRDADERRERLARVEIVQRWQLPKRRHEQTQHYDRAAEPSGLVRR